MEQRSTVDLLRMEQELVERNRAIDAKTSEVMKLVENTTAPATAPSARSASVHDPLLASKMKALENELRGTVAKVQELETLREQDALGFGKQEKALGALNVKYEKERAACQAAEERAREAETVAASQAKEIAALKKSQKTIENGVKTKDTRLQRSLEEIEKLKQEVKSLQSKQKESKDGHGEVLVKLQAENRRLSSQKQELLIGFKKQAKLIDILRRQKMHIEAAKLLSFTEEEFIKTLDIAS